MSVTQARVTSPEASPSPDKFFNCSGKWSLPLSAGEYIYRILLAKDSNPIAFNLTIDDPGELTVKDCKREVSEGDNVTCTCSTQREGSPPPVISWAGQTSPTLHLYNVRGELNMMYTCEMIWGNQTKTVSYNLLVRASDNQDKKDDSSSTSVLFIVAAAVLVIIIVTTVILIVIIRGKRRRETQQRAMEKEQGQDEEELVENRYYGGFQIDGGRDLTNEGDDYAEVAEAKSIKPDLYAGIEVNTERQTIEANKGRQVDVYACVEKNKERQPTQPELYASVVKISGKEQTKTDNSIARGKKDLTSEGDLYAIVVKGAKSESHVTSAPVEEMYAQIVKSPK